MAFDPDIEFRSYLANGDPAALARVFDAVAPRLLLLAHQLVRDANAAEDLVQDTFVAAIESADRFDRSRPVVPWLTGILANEARMEARRARRRLDPERVRKDEPVDAAREAERREANDAFRQALDALPDAYREVLRLGLLHGVGAPTIARTLGRSPNTVKTQLRRGRALLERALPAGVAPLALLALVQGTGFAAVRERVVRRVGPGGASAVVLKLVSLGLLLCTVGAWMLWPTDTDQRGSQRRTSLAPADVSVSPVATRAEADRTATGAASSELRVQACFGEVPAPGVRLFLRPVGPEAAFHERAATTDGEGWARFGDVTGSFRVRAIRGGSRRLHLDTQTTREQRLEIPEGVEVSGDVVDAEGAPMAGAAIWMAEAPRNLDDCKEVARADASGKFHLRDVQVGRVLFARWRDRVPPVGRIVLAENPPVRMQMRGIGGSIRGRVFGVDGRPQADARVLVGWGAFYMTRFHTIEPPLTASTDEAGEFVVDGVRANEEVPIWVRAEGSAIFKRVFSVRSGEATNAEIRLERPAVIHGVVRTQAGQPAGGALLTAWCSVAGMRERWYRRAPAWGANHLRAFEDGRFELLGLAPGKIELRVEHPTHGRARGSLALASGDRREWSPTLDPGLRIRGTLRDSEGNVLGGWRIKTDVANRQELKREYEVDADGRFDIGPCEDVDYTLIASDPRSPLAKHSGRMLGVRPSPTRIEFTIAAERVPRAFVTGAARAPDGSILEIYDVELRDDFGTGARGRAKDGRFRVGPLPPGRYWVHLLTAEGDRRAGRVELADRDVDVGEQRIERAGGLVLRCVNHRGRRAPVGVVPVLRDRGPPAAILHLADGEGRVKLQPGIYRVGVFTNRIAMSQARFEIRSGLETEVVLRLQRGHKRTVRFDAVPGARVLTLTWSNREGRELLRERLHRNFDSVREITRRFAPGDYRLVVEDAWKREARSEFTVENERRSEQVIRVPVPRF